MFNVKNMNHDNNYVNEQKNDVIESIENENFEYANKLITNIQSNIYISNLVKGEFYLRILTFIGRDTKKNHEILAIAKNIINLILEIKSSIIDLTIASYIKICRINESFKNANDIYNAAKNSNLVTAKILFEYILIGNSTNNLEVVIQEVEQYFLKHQDLTPNPRFLNAKYTIYDKAYDRVFRNTFFTEYFSLLQRKNNFTTGAEFYLKYCAKATIDTSDEMTIAFFKLCINLDAEGNKILALPEVYDLMKKSLPKSWLATYINKFLNVKNEEFKAEKAFSLAVKLNFINSDIISNTILWATRKKNVDKTITFCNQVISANHSIPLVIVKTAIDCITPDLKHNSKYVNDVKNIFFNALTLIKNMSIEKKENSKKIIKLYYSAMLAAREAHDWQFNYNIFTNLPEVLFFVDPRIIFEYFLALHRMYRHDIVIDFYLNHKNKFNDKFALNQSSNELASLIMRSATLTSNVTLAEELFEIISTSITPENIYNKNQIKNRLYSIYINTHNFEKAEKLWATLPTKTIIGYGSYMQYLLLKSSFSAIPEIFEKIKDGPLSPRIYILYILYLCHENNKQAIKSLLNKIETMAHSSAVLIVMLIKIMNEKEDNQIIRRLIDLAQKRQILSETHVFLVNKYCNLHNDNDLKSHIARLQPKLKERYEKSITNALAKFEALVNIKITYKPDSTTQVSHIEIDWDKFSTFLEEKDAILEDDLILSDIPTEDIDLSIENGISSNTNSSLKTKDVFWHDDFILPDLDIEMDLSQERREPINDNSNKNTVSLAPITIQATIPKKLLTPLPISSSPKNTNTTTRTDLLESLISTTNSRKLKANLPNAAKKIYSTTTNMDKSANSNNTNSQVNNNQLSNYPKKKISQISKIKKPDNASFFQAEGTHKPSTQQNPKPVSKPSTALLGDFHGFIQKNKFSKPQQYAGEFIRSNGIKISDIEAYSYINNILKKHNLTISLLKGISKTKFNEIKNVRFALPSSDNILASEQVVSIAKNSRN